MSATKTSFLPFEFPELRVVEASAGSGKTYALARRYIQLLLLSARETSEKPFRSILALTFTNKTAFEMKSRILDLLKRIAFRDLSAAESESYLAPVGLDAEAAALVARRVMEDLIRNYNYFQVQTIDKFINALLVSCAFKVGLSANFRIKTSPRAYIEYALDELIDAAGRDAGVRRMFEDFIDNYLYLENRSQWLPRESILEILTSLFMVYDNYGLPFTVRDIAPEALIREKKMILAGLKDFFEDAPLADLHAGFVKSVQGFLVKHTSGFDFDSLSDYLAREEVPAKKSAALAGTVYRKWDAIRARISNLAHLEVFCLYNPYLAIFEGVREKYEEACQRGDVLFLSELNRKARQVFEEGITPEEIYYRLASRFRHYLIDEFQDTSRLQWKNLRELPSEALSTRGSLFYVGDKKQAIYSFRGGEAGLFDEVKTEFPVEHLRTERLTTNWRSQRAIVEFNNAVFAMENLARFAREKDEDSEGKVKKDAVGLSTDDLAALEAIYAGAEQAPRPGHDAGYVRMEAVGAVGKEANLEMVKERILTLLKDLSGRFSWRDIAILARSHGELEEIAGWLLEARIPMSSERTADIKEHPLVQEVIAFLTFLSTPIDNMAFATFILGEIFCRASGLPPEQVREFILTERQKPSGEREAYLYLAFSRKFPEVWDDLIRDFFKNVGLYPLYELVVSFYSKMRCLESFPGAQGFFMHLLELVKAREEEYFDVASFLKDLDSMEGEPLYVRMTGENAVRLLTFHKAKGLEFPVVVLPFLTMKVDVGSGGSNKKQAYVLREKDGEQQFLRLKKDYGKYAEDIQALYEDEYKKNFLSEINTVYVALTRASAEMYGFIPAKAGSSRNLIRKLIPESLWEKGAQQIYSEPGKRPPESRKLSPSAGRDWIAFLKDEFMSVNELALRREREEGEQYHVLLAQIKVVLSGQLDQVLDEALASLPADDFREEARKVLRELLSEDSVRPLFAPETGEVFTEYELVDRSGRARRIDRLVVASQEALVIDFKASASGKEGGIKQVREYKELLREIFPGKAVKGFLVFIRERDVVEV
ncbi:MAG: UvrD-helicase domain-containing protein [Candidatus Omnitrophica bacterium]|nr:UvrD-helicase domain-containing protein [Candidatus Omnitrophota bacterium]